MSLFSFLFRSANFDFDRPPIRPLILGSSQIIRTLMNFDPRRKIRVETNASGFEISGIISQLVKSTNQWHLITSLSRKKNAVEINYEIKKSKMLTVIKTCKQWKHYLKSVVYQMQMIIDHCNFRNFMITKTLNRKKIKWWKKLSNLDLFIEYRSEAKNPVDDFSRRSDYESGEKRRVIEGVTKPDHILDIKDYVLCVVCDEAERKKVKK